MKYRIVFLGIMGVLSMACSVNEMDIAVLSTRDCEEFYATIEDASTKVFADEKLRVLWNADDRVSIFNKYTYNQEYRFTGEDGDNSGSFKKVPNDDFVTGNALDLVYSVYPYQESTKINNDGVITVTLPAEQSYRENSFGQGTNTMISATEDNQLLYKNLCGYLAIKLYGDKVSVTSITLKGNNDEFLAGKATVIASVNEVPSMSFDPSATKEITLSFENAVTLGTTAESATTFWIVVPPTVFSKGFTLTVKDDENGVFEKSTTKSFEIGRNKLARMSALEVTPEPSDDAIVFADIIAKYACVAKFDTNSDGEVSFKEAAAVNSLDGLFSDWNTVTSFEEIQYFTNVTSTENVFTGLKRLASITIPPQITTLGTFQDCSSLTTVTLPSKLAYLPANCFNGCTSLSDVTLPIGITDIPNNCFQNCSSLITLSIPNTVSTIGNRAFYYCTSLVNLSIPSGLKSIRDYSFCGCESIASISLPSELTTLGVFAFSGCRSLASVSLPIDLTYLPKGCFSGCFALSSIEWPKALTTIGVEAFADCDFADSNYTVEIPTSVATISSKAFGPIHHLILSSSSFISIASDSFKRGYSFLYVPSEMVESYKIRSNWSNYADHIRPIEDYPAEPSLGGTKGEAIDLGLSVKWASWNIGASAPEEYGAYYAWGETEPKWWDGYSWTTYKWCNGSNQTMTKYNTNSTYGFVDYKSTLESEDDVAQKLWGGAWRMPTLVEIKELLDNCTIVWTNSNGINGCRFYSNLEGYSDRSVFFPAAGLYNLYGDGVALMNAGEVLYYWTSSLESSRPYSAYILKYLSDNASYSYVQRNYGLPVRPVYDE
jgi:hypothetical protein